MIFILSGSTVFASGYSNEIQLTVKQRYEVKSYSASALNGLKGQYKFTALDSSYPMPDGSVENVLRFDLCGQQDQKIILLNFEETGKYEYLLEQVNTNKDNYILDKSKYKISIYIEKSTLGEISSQVIVENDKNEKVGDLVFTNYYDAPYKSVKTGDDLNLFLYIATIIILFSILFAITSVKSRRRAD